MQAPADVHYSRIRTTARIIVVRLVVHRIVNDKAVARVCGRIRDPQAVLSAAEVVGVVQHNLHAHIVVGGVEGLLLAAVQLHRVRPALRTDAAEEVDGLALGVA